MTVTWAGALGWRLRRQLLDPVGEGSVVDVVERLGAVPAWPDLTAELGVAARRREGHVGDAAAALAAGELVKVFAFRGGMHLMTPRDAGAYLAVRASSRMWELTSWQEFYRLTPGDWPAFREHVRGLLADGPLTHAGLLAGLRRSRRYRHLAAILADGNDTLLKPLTWQGDLGLGLAPDGSTTFLRLEDVPGWAGLPDAEEAGAAVVAAYLRTSGPADAGRLTERVGKGLGARGKDVARWVAAVGARCVEVDVEGDRLLVLEEDAEELRTATPSTAVRLLPGRDPWVMAAGSADARVVPPARRGVVSRSSHLVLAGGVLAGTWTLRGSRVDVVWFAETGAVPRAALEDEVAALARRLDRDLDLSVATG
ncbi:MAG: DNA glycosylase AlkZ-like family protein [Nocardioides sp.]